MKTLALILLSLLVQACATVGSADRPQSYYQDPSITEHSGIESESTLGDDDGKIIRLLHHQIKLPKVNRIAILKLSKDNNWRFYSNDFTELNDSIAVALIDRLRASPRVYDASYLPAMLVPEKRTVPILREAAARFQADLLLGYRSSCNSYQKYNLLAADQAKSYCSIEAILLDIRSGIIVKSVVSVEHFSATKQADDTDFAETRKRAELEAIAKALGNIAQEVVDFMATVSVQ